MVTMRLPRFILSITVISTCYLSWTRAQLCLFHPNPLSPSTYTPSHCPIIDKAKQPQLHLRDQLTFNGTNAFQIDFTCLENNKTLCAQAQQTYVRAGEIISGILQLSTPITVNATFLSFCKVLGLCPAPDGSLPVGQAYPATTHLMLDRSDNITRLYPQALLKQLNLSQHPSWSQYDIQAMFTSDQAWWFEGDGPINSTQVDFTRTVLHEYVHGLGFISGWTAQLSLALQALNPAIPSFLTPTPLGYTNGSSITLPQNNSTSPASPTPSGNDTSSSQPLAPSNGTNIAQEIAQSDQDINGFIFVEWPLDKYIVSLADKQPLSRFTQVFRGYTSLNTSQTLTEWASVFLNSSALGAGIQVLKLGTTPKSIGVVAPNQAMGEAYILETSLKPFSDGSSISHDDNTTYADTQEYLMVYAAQRGISIDHYEQTLGGPFGPKLMQTLKLLGYALANATDGGAPGGNSTMNTISPDLVPQGSGIVPNYGSDAVRLLPTLIAILVSMMMGIMLNLH